MVKLYHFSVLYGYLGFLLLGSIFKKKFYVEHIQGGEPIVMSFQ